MGPIDETAGEKPAVPRGPEPDDIDIKITPSMRRKLDDLARWLSAGDGARIRRSTQAVLDLLLTAARETRPRGR